MMKAEAASELEVVTRSAEETRSLGGTIGQALQRGDVLGLSGNLGAGKTTLTQGIGSGLGIRGYMRSPTFTLVNEYDLDSGAKLLHLDGYRLGETLADAMLEAETFGLEHLFDDEDAIIVIEWAERVATVLPKDRLEVRITYGDHSHERRFTLIAHGPRSRAILQQLQD